MPYRRQRARARQEFRKLTSAAFGFKLLGGQIGATWQFAAGYAAWPRWSPDGKEIFFRTVDYRAAWVASYSVNGDTFVPGAVRPFGGDVQAMAIGDTWVFSIAPQGNRVVELVAAKDPEGTRPRPDYVLLLNFFDEIRRRSAQAGAR